MSQGTVGRAAQGARDTRDPRELAQTPAFGLWLRGAGLLCGFVLLFTWPARLFDSDAYLHLALARTIAAHGFIDHLEWARFSTLGQSYGDKELLFHLLLIPFVKLADPELGGKLALAVLCTAISMSLWALGVRALGRLGFLVPVLVWSSGSFVLRAIRLRPELLSLVLLVWVLWALAARRYWLAAALSCVFALAHTAFHSLLGLAVAFFVWQGASKRPWEWPYLAATVGGVTAGVLVHPQFPRNLSVFWVQNVEFFRLRATLDVGGEFQAHSLFSLLSLDGLFWLGLIVLGLSSVRRSSAQDVETSDARDTARRMATACWIASLAFGSLFSQMGRFASLVIPFVTLACSFELRARGLRLGSRLSLLASETRARSVTLGCLAALSCGYGLATAWVNWQLGGSFDPSLRRELEQLARQLPPGARVAATWDDAELYAFYAPHARYLNVYDPVFMAVGDPARHALWSRVLAGDVPDLPDAIRHGLDSEYLALALGSHPALELRLSNEPRIKLLQLGRYALFRIQPEGARDR